MITSPTPATTACARTPRTVIAAVAAFGCVSLPRLPRRRPSTPSRGILFDRRRMFRGGQTLNMPRLPDGRRAAGWSGGRCVDGTLSRPALRSRVSFPEHGPAASSLPQGNCRPVDPRGSRPANLSVGAIEGWREPKWPNQPPHRSGELSTCVHNRRLTAVPAVVAGVIAGAHLGAFNAPSGPSSNRFRQDEMCRDLCRCLALLGWQQCTSRPLAERMLSKSTLGPQDEGRCAGAPGTAVESGTRHLSRDPAGASLLPVAAMRHARLAGRPVEQRCSRPAFLSMRGA